MNRRLFLAAAPALCLPKSLRSQTTLLSGAVGPLPTATAWNPSDKNAGVTLSGSNLIAAGNTTGPTQVRSVASLVASQKVYIEYVFNVTTGTGDGTPQVGFAIASHSLTQSLGVPVSGSFGLKNGRNGYGYFYNEDSADHGSVGFNPPAANGGVVSVAFDSGANRIWFRNNGGNWNNNGTFDPATNVGGFITNISAGAIFAIADFEVSGDQVTARFSSASWTFAAPSGFTQFSS